MTIDVDLMMFDALKRQISLWKDTESRAEPHTSLVFLQTEGITLSSDLHFSKIETFPDPHLSMFAIIFFPPSSLWKKRTSWDSNPELVPKNAEEEMIGMKWMSWSDCHEAEKSSVWWKNQIPSNEIFSLMERFVMKLTATQKSETKKDFPQWSQKFCDRVYRKQPSQKISRNWETETETASKSQNHKLTRKKCSNPMNSWWNDDHRLVLTKHGVLEKEKILLNSNMTWHEKLTWHAGKRENYVGCFVFINILASSWWDKNQMDWMFH